MMDLDAKICQGRVVSYTLAYYTKLKLHFKKALYDSSLTSTG
jgi:hypothetical protein